MHHIFNLLLFSKLFNNFIILLVIIKNKLSIKQTKVYFNTLFVITYK